MLDRFYRQRYKILGGPGCGKTTKILTTLREYFNKFYEQYFLEIGSLLLFSKWRRIPYSS